jgi:hypothetical protein
VVPIDRWLKPVTFITCLPLKQNVPHCNETDGSFLTLVYRLITSYSRRHRIALPSE